MAPAFGITMNAHVHDNCAVESSTQLKYLLRMDGVISTTKKRDERVRVSRFTGCRIFEDHRPEICFLQLEQHKPRSTITYADEHP